MGYGPGMYRAFRLECRSGRLRPGDVFVWRGPDKAIFNSANRSPVRHSNGIWQLGSNPDSILPLLETRYRTRTDHVEDQCHPKQKGGKLVIRPRPAASLVSERSGLVSRAFDSGFTCAFLLLSRLQSSFAQLVRQIFGFIRRETDPLGSTIVSHHRQANEITNEIAEVDAAFDAFMHLAKPLRCCHSTSSYIFPANFHCGL